MTYNELKSQGYTKQELLEDIMLCRKAIKLMGEYIKRFPEHYDMCHDIIDVEQSNLRTYFNWLVILEGKGKDGTN